MEEADMALPPGTYTLVGKIEVNEQTNKETRCFQILITVLAFCSEETYTEVIRGEGLQLAQRIYIQVSKHTQN